MFTQRIATPQITEIASNHGVIGFSVQTYMSHRPRTKTKSPPRKWHYVASKSASVTRQPALRVKKIGSCWPLSLISNTQPAPFSAPGLWQ
jgi:hypothetical protein